MGHFGFSCIGLLYLLMLFIPDMIWAKRQPKWYVPGGEKKWLLWMERIGQVCVTGAALLFSDYS